jgi:hypothetical protein
MFSLKRIQVQSAHSINGADTPSRSEKWERIFTKIRRRILVGIEPNREISAIDWCRLAEIDIEIRQVRTDIMKRAARSSIVGPVGGEIIRRRR